MTVQQFLGFVLLIAFVTGIKLSHIFSTCMKPIATFVVQLWNVANDATFVVQLWNVANEAFCVILATWAYESSQLSSRIETICVSRWRKIDKVINLSQPAKLLMIIINVEYILFAEIPWTIRMHLLLEISSKDNEMMSIFLYYSI